MSARKQVASDGIVAAGRDSETERNPSNQYVLEDPGFKLAMKIRVARQERRDVWKRTYSRLSPISKRAVRACMHDVERVKTRPFHTHAMRT